MIHRTLKVSLCSTEPHSDAVFSCPVAASGQTADVILLDVQPEQRQTFYIFYPTFISLFTVKESLNSWSIRNTYTIHDTPPIKTLTSLGCPVLSLRPLMVRDEPPALGPLWGKMLLSTGSWRRRERGEEER